MLKLQGSLAHVSVEEQTFWRIFGVLRELKNMRWVQMQSYSFALKGKRGCCCAGDDMKTAVTPACRQYWVCCPDYRAVHQGCSGTWQLSVLASARRPNFGKVVKLGRESVVKSGVTLLVCAWSGAHVAGGHVRRRLGCRNGSAGWIQEYALGTGVLCLRDKCRSTLWNTISACSQALVLLKTIGR